MKYCLFIFLISFYGYGQWEQIGQDLVGDVNCRIGTDVEISADGTVIAFGSIELNTDCHVVKVFEYSGGNWIQKGQTFAPEKVDDIVLSGDGNTLAFTDGTPFDFNLFIYKYDGNNWVLCEQYQDLPSGFNVHGNTGNDPMDLSFDGNTIAIGAKGSVYTLEYVNGVWQQFGQTLENPDDPEDNIWYGQTISLSADGQTLLVASSRSRARVYKFLNDSWEQIGQDLSGFVIAIIAADISSDGKTVVIQRNINHKEILKYNEDLNTWQSIQLINSATVKAKLNGSGSIFTSLNYIYQNNNGDYTEIGNIEMEGVSGQMFSNINETGNMVVIGSLYYGSSNNGIVRVFKNDEILSTDNEKIDDDVLIFPNPSKNAINFTEPLKGIIIYNSFGEIIKIHKNSTKKIEISSLTNGYYIISGSTESGKKIKTKFLKN